MTARSCDGCRYRKIKCERTGEGGCIQCRQKGFECVTTHLTRKPYKARSGKRIDTLKQMQNKAAASIALRVSSDMASSRVARLEEVDAFAANLVDVYFTSLSQTIPLEKWTHIREQFHSAGRRPSQIPDPMTEILIRCAMAFGVLVSDCPALVGQDAPALSDLDQLRGKHLDIYGQRRAATAALLYEEAMLLVDSRGIFHSNSPDAIAVLLICFELGSFIRSSVSRERAPTQPYIEAAVSLMKRTSIASPTPDPFHCRNEELLGNTYCTWTAAVAEAAHSAYLGNESSISERQLPWFFGPLRPLEKHAPFDHARIQHIVSSGKAELIGSTIQALWYQIYRVLRSLAQTVSVPIKWDNDLPYTAILAIIAQVEKVYRAIDISFDGLNNSPYAAVLPGQVVIEKNLVAAQLTISAAVRLLHFQVNKFKEKAPLQRFHPDEEQAGTLRMVQDRVAQLLIITARRMSACIASQEPLDMVLFNAPLSIVSVMPEFWARVLLEAQSSTEGGPADWSAQSKAQDVECLIDALKVQSWIWPTRSQEARELEQSLRNFNAMWMFPSLSTISTCTEPDPSTTELLFDPFNGEGISSIYPAGFNVPFPCDDLTFQSPPIDAFDVLDFLDLNNSAQLTFDTTKLP